MRARKATSLRIDVHHADAVVWGPVSGARTLHFCPPDAYTDARGPSPDGGRSFAAPARAAYSASRIPGDHRLTVKAYDAIALPISNPAGTKSVARPLLASPATNRRARGRVRISSSQRESSRVAGAAPCNSRKCLGSFHTKRRRGEVQRRQFELKGVAGGH